MRKVSLLCLLGLFATAPMVSFADDAEVVQDVYIAAVKNVLKSNDAKYMRSKKSDVNTFIEDLEKSQQANGGKVSLETVLKLCPKYLTDDAKVESFDNADLNYCVQFGEAVIAENNKIVEQERMIDAKNVQPLQGTPVYTPVKLDGSRDTNNTEYTVQGTQYGYAVFKRKRKGALEFQCLLGDMGTTNCDNRKACALDDDRSPLFICGGQNNSTLTGGFLVLRDRRLSDAEKALYYTNKMTAETRASQLSVLNTPVVTAEDLATDKRQEEPKPSEDIPDNFISAELSVTALQPKPCEPGYAHPDKSFSLSLGQCSDYCRLDEKECYKVEMLRCMEAAELGEQALWQGDRCGCYNGKTWDAARNTCCGKGSVWDKGAKKCVKDPSEPSFCEQLKLQGASAARLACCAAGKATKWDGDVKQGTCSCVDTSKVWDGKKCLDNPEKVNCLKFEAVGQATWNDDNQSCKCTDKTMKWNGTACVKNESDCSEELKRAYEKSVTLTEDKLDFVVPTAGLYTNLVNNVSKYNMALSVLRPGEKKETLLSKYVKMTEKDACNVIKDTKLAREIDEENRLVANIESNVERFKEFNKKGIRFWTRSYGEKGEPKYMNVQQDMVNDAIYQTWYTIANTKGYDAHMYTGKVDYNMAGEADRKLKYYFGSRPNCDLDRRSNIVLCELQTKQGAPVIMRFSYALWNRN